MLHQLANGNSVEGLWGTFEDERARLNLQYVNHTFVEGSGLTPDELRAGFAALSERLAGEAPNYRKARLFEYVLQNARISVDSKDWFADKLDSQGLMREYNRAMLADGQARFYPETDRAMRNARSHGYHEAPELDTGHVSPGWRYLINKGLLGILDEAKKAREGYGDTLTAQQADFYDSLEITYNAIIHFCHRLASMASQLADASAGGQKIRLLTVADSLRNVPQNPPRDFHEALQFAYIMHQMIELEGEWVRSMGGFDRTFGGFYDQDIKSGKLTPDTAKELIKFFYTKYFANTRGAGNGKNFYFGGQYADGNNAENELTYLALDAYHEMNITDPKLSVRFYNGSTERLYTQVMNTIRAGRTAFVLVNDDVAIPAIMTQGKTLEEAREFLLIGCYEPAIEGKEVACNMAIDLNMAKSVELALNRGRDMADNTPFGPDTGDPLEMKTYEEFEEAYFTQLRAQIDDVTYGLTVYETYWKITNPSPALAGSFQDAVKKGVDIGAGGAKYNNTGCMGAGLGTTVDSLSAIKKAVYEEKVCTMAQMLTAIKDDFVGHEKLKLYLDYRIPRWGNADPEADGIAIRIVENYSAHVNGKSNGRGGKFVHSMFSLDHCNTLGSRTAALPNGRNKGEPLSLNNAASIGKDIQGVTALLISATCLDYGKLPNGSVTDVYLHPSAIQGDDGLAAFIALVKTYFERGGYGIQFNIFDAETLIDAQKHPENYQTLQIRVCGWNVYFVTMSPAEQERYIRSNIHAV